MVKSTQPTFQKEVIVVKPHKHDTTNESCCIRCIKCECEGNQTDKRICLKNFTEYLESPYCITEYCAKLDDNDPCCDIFMTLIFCAPKQVTFFTCLLGAILNGCINHYKKTDKNYLC